MELIEQTSPAVASSKSYSGSGSFNVAAGKSLKIETSPLGESILDMTVPEGKSWQASVTISITETNV